MRFRLGVLTGFGVGYYLGAKAGRQRYEQMHRALHRVKRSDTFETVSERARAVVEESVGTARDLVESRMGNGRADDQSPTRFN
ncbi:MAG TPA: hypothetical protein VHF00_01635 [Acidimicrobiales bacterium]|jgi:hypothetical protein|nr:hypothetical protein [Acidimicrobiales bacterium]